MNRIQPIGGVSSYQTYQIKAPIATHWRKATCAEIECAHYLNGWRVRLESLPPEMVHAARNSGRKFTELHVSAEENWLVFEAGQACFQESAHKVPLDRQELFIVRDGDWRGNPTGRVRQHTNPEHWVEQMDETFDGIRTAQQRG